MSEQVYCVMDYETVSEADLPKVGGYEYAKHKSTNMLCVSWRVGTRAELRRQIKEGVRPKAWSPAIPSNYGEFKNALLDPNVILVAHNAFFEQVITRYVLTKLIFNPELKEIPSSRWICTASMARALALPGKLEQACAALKLPIQKDMDGHKLMMRMAKPRPAYKKWIKEGRPERKGGAPKKWNRKLSELLRLIEYCKTDVDAETLVFLTLPELSPSERKIWLLDQRINFRGFNTDRLLVKKILGMIAEESRRFLRETRELTRGVIESTAQRDATLKWLRTEAGLDLPDLKAKTVEDALQTGLATGKAKALLLIRRAASKTSTAKYAAFEMRSRTDGRIRDAHVYHVASTGRWGGAGVQPQNLPKGTIGNTDLAAEILSDPATDLELIRLLYGNPLDVFSSVLRSMVIPGEGNDFVQGDYSAIEAKVVFWMARHEDGLRAYREKRDLYIEMAADIFGKDIKDVTKKERNELGKGAILGCGFGMGKKKFFETCKTKGQEVTEELAAAAVTAYRTKHRPVVKLWSNLEKAAMAAVQNRGRRYTINRTSWWVEGNFLFCALPSGRRLAYYGPEVRFKATSWGEKRPTLYHWGVDSTSKKWVINSTWGGTLTENVVQATARDIMGAAIGRVEDAGYEVVLHAHDELLTERDRAKVSIEEFTNLMSVKPEWADDDLPTSAEGWRGRRYKK